ncbi:coserved hypothetical protein [Renibacterium salmoninarum ATCC 33209]|uniref:Ribosomal RNA small subunit methyltransferase E n=1 Tax=Renibacterium salmoninarum (strain ATCC 33209 / DSM 20767 / JCM 11484 / NBRC 15589 / NCIMB 2235) TaxID=288705 RepID=A9WQS9_RENSM|nr:16S rRNA (uracil(1498)-N(3))-methyltransferase [Renibacterium salmoninarum]ABY23658.1 coserved hypothetical protein [Renibacterium salmoninarum ATCC 33209]
MTNPVFFADAASIADLEPGDDFELAGDEGHHAATVKRIAVDEHLDIVDGVGLRLNCIVLQTAPGTLTVRVQSRLAEPAPQPRLVLVQALAKDGRDELAIETATELGVDAVIPWQADRSIVRWRPERVEKSMAKWAKTIQAATKQARRARTPLLLDPVDSPGLVKRIALLPKSRMLVLHEEATTDLLQLVDQYKDVEELLLVVGPEGGMSDRELELFSSAGSEKLRLGPHVLRSSTAGPAAVVLLSEALGRWRVTLS